MLGRVLTYQKCPVCSKPFTVLPDEQGITCLEHKTHPTKYYINANQLHAGRIYSDPQGNPFDSYKVTLRQLETMRREYDQHILNPDDWIPSKIRHYQFENLASEWLRGYEIEVKNETKANSYVRNLIQRVRDYLMPEFQTMDVRDIREPQIRKFYHDLLEGKKLSHKTIKHILNTLQTFLIAHGEIIKKIPKIPKFTVMPKREKKWLDTEKQMMIFTHIPKEYHLAFEVLFNTGMRPGELRALKSKDLRDGSITVSRAFSGNALRKITKTGVEITYKMSYELYRKLLEHTRDKSFDEFIFTNNGKPLSKDRLYWVWRIACEKAGNEYITLYQASRHSMVSQIRQQKEIEALKEASEKLGHTHSSTTKQHYMLNDSKEIK